ncbi:hypothetical protein Ae201684P_017487 [Aphanomyces euteiches]|uniref:Uncharacterized protein n=1 Tax=Aphanomyces euteiches TaxID=100861 RepID=A0A6G0XNE8_9STRA|nr:hypothetical protein Ae201684_003102 [Aphanomyces euteiches]KAH9098271.1 hypothetical protein Ae201684P_017487 [Aphanomyces euteiches]KAH9153083.1 hypothetical protein AeRB84_004598 [Aphanomyces euteiches]
MLFQLVRIYLAGGFLVELHAFVRLTWTSTPLGDLNPSLNDTLLDTVPIFRRLFGYYCLTLGILRLAAAYDMQNAALFAALAVTHVLEAVFTIVEVLVYQGIPVDALLQEKNVPNAAFLALLVFQASMMGAAFDVNDVCHLLLNRKEDDMDQQEEYGHNLREKTTSAMHFFAESWENDVMCPAPSTAQNARTGSYLDANVAPWWNGTTRSRVPWTMTTGTGMSPSISLVGK